VQIRRISRPIRESVSFWGWAGASVWKTSSISRFSVHLVLLSTFLQHSRLGEINGCLFINGLIYFGVRFGLFGSAHEYEIWLCLFRLEINPIGHYKFFFWTN
jgi:hypothetical protein